MLILTHANSFPNSVPAFFQERVRYECEPDSFLRNINISELQD